MCSRILYIMSCNADNQLSYFAHPNLVLCLLNTITSENSARLPENREDEAYTLTHHFSAYRDCLWTGRHMSTISKNKLPMFLNTKLQHQLVTTAQLDTGVPFEHAMRVLWDTLQPPATSGALPGLLRSLLQIFLDIPPSKKKVGDGRKLALKCLAFLCIDCPSNALILSNDGPFMTEIGGLITNETFKHASEYGRLALDCLFQIVVHQEAHRGVRGLGVEVPLVQLCERLGAMRLEEVYAKDGKYADGCGMLAVDIVQHMFRNEGSLQPFVKSGCLQRLSKVVAQMGNHTINPVSSLKIGAGMAFGLRSLGNDAGAAVAFEKLQKDVKAAIVKVAVGSETRLSVRQEEAKRLLKELYLIEKDIDPVCEEYQRAQGRRKEEEVALLESQVRDAESSLLVELEESEAMKDKALKKRQAKKRREKEKKEAERKGKATAAAKVEEERGLAAWKRVQEMEDRAREKREKFKAGKAKREKWAAEKRAREMGGEDDWASGGESSSGSSAAESSSEEGEQRDLEAELREAVAALPAPPRQYGPDSDDESSEGAGRAELVETARQYMNETGYVRPPPGFVPSSEGKAAEESGGTGESWVLKQLQAKLGY